jgi:PAS domain S-box-containing protein
MKSSPPKKASTAGQKSKLKPVVKAMAKIETQWVEPKQRPTKILKDITHHINPLDDLLEGCQIIDFDWRYIYINNAAEKHNRRPKAELLGKKYMDMWPGIEATEVFRVIKRCMEERVPHQMENEFIFPSGAKGWFSLSIQPIPEGVFILSFNITDRKQAEAELQQSEELFRLLMESVRDYAIIILDPTGHVVSWNTGAEHIKGYRAQEIIGKHFSRFYRDTDVQNGKPEQELAIAREQGQFQEESWRVRKDGSLFMADVTISPLFNRVGELRGFVKLIRDITERKKAEEALSQSEALYHRLFENMLNGFAYCKMLFDQENPQDFIYLEVNRSFEMLTGLKDVTGKKVSEVIPGLRESDPELFKIYGRVALTGIPETFENFVEPLKMWFSISVYSPQKEYFVAVFDVITDRKQAEEVLQKAHDDLEIQVQQRTAALSEANLLLQTLLDNMPDQIYFKDPRSRFIKNSRAQTKALGLSDSSQVVGKTDFDFFPHAQQSYDQEQEIIRSGDPLIDFEEHVIWPDGRETWVSTTKVPLRDPEEKIIGTMGISRDITDRKRNEDALRKARDELEAFSYSVSHDLRAPLRGIDGWSQALLEDYGTLLDEQGQEYIKRVRSETQRMGELIDDMLQLSRITRAEMHTERVDLSALARSIAARLQDGEPQRHIVFKIQDGLSARGDAHLMEVVLTNLLSNAIKFTGKIQDAHIEFGQIEIKSEQAFFVRDNGVGFDMTYAKKLFVPFQRLHKASEFPGTGVGLATVQRIIHRHGGRVWAESAVDKGATFFFTL